MSTAKPNRRHFTEAARAAAAEGRRRRREEARPLDAPEVFVVRHTAAPLRFAWEVRRFGAVVVDRGAEHYASPHDARRAGERALTGLVLGS